MSSMRPILPALANLDALPPLMWQVIPIWQRAGLVQEEWVASMMRDTSWPIRNRMMKRVIPIIQKLYLMGVSAPALWTTLTPIDPSIKHDFAVVRSCNEGFRKLLREEKEKRRHLMHYGGEKWYRCRPLPPSLRGIVSDCQRAISQIDRAMIAVNDADKVIKAAVKRTAGKHSQVMAEAGPRLVQVIMRSTKTKYSAVQLAHEVLFACDPDRCPTWPSFRHSAYAKRGKAQPTQ